MNYVGPVLLGPDHILAGFDCGKEALNDWLAQHALSNQQTGTSRTWVVTDETQRVVAFYASATAVVLRSEATSKARRNQPEQIPAVLLGRMAVDAKHKGKGLGAALLKHFLVKAIEVSQAVGVRLLLVHAKDDEARSFYEHYEFERSPIDGFTLMLLVQDIPGMR
jgi:GNAT superfamily N-acetyltransferase